MAVPRKTLGDYLSENEPVAALWPDLVNCVFRDNKRSERLDRLTPEARTLYLVGCYYGEIINGGFSQFFSNSAGNSAHETRDALRQIGAGLCVSLLERALTLFPSSIAPSDRRMRCELLFAFEENDPRFLEDLSREFYQRVDPLGSEQSEDLTQLGLAFMRSNAFKGVSVEDEPAHS